jgi:citrate synthase
MTELSAMAALWITADEAQARLGIRLQTLSAYVSRGLVTARTDETDPRRSLYAAEDVTRLIQRRNRGRGEVAQRALDHGDPVLSSAITTVHDARPWYRGRDAIAWAETATLEETARLLWDCDEDPFIGLAPHPSTGVGGDARARAFSLLAYRAASDPATSGRSDKALRREAASIMIDLVDAMSGASRNGLIHERLAKTWRVDSAKADILRRCLVLAADHELNASTFAARVAASTGASLAACGLAGLSTLSGPLHGGMTLQVAAFIAECRRTNDPRSTAALRLSQGLEVPGFGQRSYPAGDPRARAISQSMIYADDLREIAVAGEAVTGVAPNLDFALVAATRTLGLPVDAAFTLFTVGRAVGWFAHAIEQRSAGRPIRPRARYIGHVPGYLDREEMVFEPAPPPAAGDEPPATEAPAPIAASNS